MNCAIFRTMSNVVTFLGVNEAYSASITVGEICGKNVITFQRLITFGILFKNRNFVQKSQFWSKIAILVKNRKFAQKLQFWSKIGSLLKNWNFGQKSQFWSKIAIFGQKIVIFVETPDFVNLTLPFHTPDRLNQLAMNIVFVRNRNNILTFYHFYKIYFYPPVCDNDAVF